MKINKSKRTNKYWIIAVAIIVIIAGYLVSANFMKWYPFQAITTGEQKNTPLVNDINYDKPTKEEQNAPTDMTEEGSVNLPGKTDTGNVAISSLQIDPSGNLRIGTIIQTLTSGECTLIVTKSGQAITEQKVGTQPLSNTSTCKGFTVAADMLPSGTYGVEVTYIHENIRGYDKREVIVP